MYKRWRKGFYIILQCRLCTYLLLAQAVAVVHVSYLSDPCSQVYNSVICLGNVIQLKVQGVCGPFCSWQCDVASVSNSRKFCLRHHVQSIAVQGPCSLLSN